MTTLPRTLSDDLQAEVSRWGANPMASHYFQRSLTFKILLREISWQVGGIGVQNTCDFAS
jgi:hypothetical protein